MNGYKKSDFTYINQARKAREAAIKKAKARIPRQKCSEDVPRFPIGYKNPANKSEQLGKAERPYWLERHDYAGDLLTNDWISSTPTRQQLLNLFCQLEKHALGVGATFLDWELPHSADNKKPLDEEDKKLISADATKNGEESDKDNNQKYDMLTLPSRRVEEGKTPCTTFPRKKVQQNDNNLNPQQDQSSKIQNHSDQIQDQDQDKGDLDQEKDPQKQPHFNKNKHGNKSWNERRQWPGYKHGQEQQKGREGKEEEKEQQDDVPDSYHIIRFRDRRVDRKYRFVEFLRRDVNGYILAFRVYEELSQAENAYFCCCSDAFAQLTRDLPFFKFKKIHCGSGYSSVDRVVFGKDTIEIIFDVLYDCYSDPKNYYNHQLSYFLQIIFVLLGEGPRFEEVRRAIFRTIETETHATCPKLGVLLDLLVHQWKNLSLTAFILKLVLLEKEAAFRLMNDRRSRLSVSNPHPTLGELFAEFDSHWLIAQKRCTNIVESNSRINKILNLEKDEDLDGNKLDYGKIAYEKIIHDEVPFLLFMEEVGITTMMRRDEKFGGRLYPPLKPYSNDGDDDDDVDREGKKAADEFWKMFKDFRVKKGRHHILTVLCSSLPYLESYFFSKKNPDLYQELQDVCSAFKSLSSNQTKAVAATSTKKGHPGFFQLSKLETIWDFLDTNSPVQVGSEKGIVYKVAKERAVALLASRAEAEKQSDLDARVLIPKERIEHALEDQDRNPPVDIGLYGNQIVDKLSSRTDTGTASFSEIVSGEPNYEAARTVSAVLQLVNDRSVDLEKRQARDELFCYTAANPNLLEEVHRRLKRKRRKMRQRSK